MDGRRNKKLEAGIMLLSAHEPVFAESLLCASSWCLCLLHQVGKQKKCQWPDTECA